MIAQDTVAIHDLTILLVNYNGGKWVELTLNTLKAHYLDQTKLQVKTVLVDNASTDGSIERIEAHYPWVELQKLSENKGFGAANNVVLRQLQAAQTSRYVLLLNTDVELDGRSNFDHLISHLDQHQDMGVITPSVLLTNGQLDPACHRGEPSPWAAITYFLGLERRWPHSKLLGQYHQGYKDLATIHEIDACSGAAMMVRVSALAEVGVFDERFFMYAEDLDWCKRFREADYKVVFFPAVTIVHHKHKSGIGSSEAQTASLAQSQFYSTMQQYFDKHYNLEYPSVLRWFITTGIAVKKRVAQQPLQKGRR